MHLGYIVPIVQYPTKCETRVNSNWYFGEGRTTILWSSLSFCLSAVRLSGWDYCWVAGEMELIRKRPMHPQNHYGYSRMDRERIYGTLEFYTYVNNSTPDCRHEEQTAFILRYLRFDVKKSFPDRRTLLCFWRLSQQNWQSYCYVHM